jgi:hypothetical protein
MIATLLLVLLLGGAGAYYVVSQPGLDVIGSSVIAQILEPITLAVTRTFTILGYLAVPLMAVVPVYVLWSHRQKGDDSTQVLIWGLVYGAALYGIAAISGLDNLLSQAMRSSMAATPMMGSSLGMAVSALGSAANWLIGVLQGVALWGAGILLTIVGGVLDAMAGLGSAAEKASKPVKKAQKGILERLLGGGS